MTRAEGSAGDGMARGLSDGVRSLAACGLVGDQASRADVPPRPGEPRPHLPRGALLTVLDEFRRGRALALAVGFAVLAFGFLCGAAAAWWIK